MIKTYNQIIQNLKEENFSKIYLLMGEESFFINKISTFFEKKFIQKEHQSFNLEIHYGRDTTIEKILNSSKSFPMMSDKKLVVVKESKELDVFKRANNSRACPESPKISCTNANIIQTTNQTKINILILSNIFWIWHSNFIISCIYVVNFTCNTFCKIT